MQLVQNFQYLEFGNHHQQHDVKNNKALASDIQIRNIDSIVFERNSECERKKSGLVT